MSSTLDPAKLKVVELRAELSKRGLDTKGNKPALVKRLKEALEEELKEEIPDTSIADTSTEDLDSSQTQEQPSVEENKPPEKEVELTDDHSKSQPEEKIEDKISEDEPKPEKVEPEEETVLEKVVDKVADAVESELLQQESELNSDSEIKQHIQEEQELKQEETKENGDQNEEKPEKIEDSEMKNSETKKNDESIENNQDKGPDTVKAGDSDSKGEKRKHSSPSPDRSQRRRSKSPVKEDEPPIDNSKVQLSWYDSDLHLQLDKDSFLSAKPYHEGAFGFAWAGVRATHGVNFGKVCFEVKITEELKWEDFSKFYDKHRRDQSKSSKHKAEDEKKKVEEPRDKEDKSKSESIQSENGEKVDLPEHQPEIIESSEVEMSEDNKKDSETEVEHSQTAQVEVMETEDDKEQTDEKDILESKDQIEPIPTHLFRVGWSLSDTALQLGEDKFSYGFESSGRFVTEKNFQDYGIKFSVGDVVGSFLHINENNITIIYSVNGVVQSEAVTLSKSEMPENFAFFPHVLSRNYAFELNLGSKEESWFPKPENLEEYEFLDKAQSKILGPVRPESRSDCEVILMCGLPASGKTHWVREYVEANPNKKYTLLGNTHLLEKMTISGDALKSKYQGSWNILLDKLQKCLNKLIEIAALRRRNYIIDQTNVFPSAQRRKLRPFEGFKRRAVVVVVGDEEQAKRQSLQEAQDGKDVPDSAVLEMKANMSLPQKGEWLDEVIYAGLGEEEAKAVVQKYNNQGREAGYGIQRRFGHRDDRHRWQNRRNDYRGGNYRDRNYHNMRYDRGPIRQSNWHPQRPGGWNRDRRDNRGPPMGGSRDWRNNRGSGRDRGNRDQGNNYNRNRNQPVRGPSGSWQSSGWGQSQGGWGSQAWGGQGSWGQSGWSNQNQNQWKYGGGSQSYGNYPNWNYYGQYAQNWNPQGQTHSASNTAGANTNQFSQYSQQEWAQYAQQYVQQGQNTSGSGTNPSALQK